MYTYRRAAASRVTSPITWGWDSDDDNAVEAAHHMGRILVEGGKKVSSLSSAMSDVIVEMIHDLETQATKNGLSTDEINSLVEDEIQPILDGIKYLYR